MTLESTTFEDPSRCESVSKQSIGSLLTPSPPSGCSAFTTSLGSLALPTNRLLCRSLSLNFRFGKIHHNVLDPSLSQMSAAKVAFRGRCRCTACGVVLDVAVVWVCDWQWSACGNDRLAVQKCCCSGSGSSSTNRISRLCIQHRNHIRTLLRSICIHH